MPSPYSAEMQLKKYFKKQKAVYKIPHAVQEKPGK